MAETVKLAINGFGRIGRIVFRESLRRNNVEVVAINDVMDVMHIAYAIQYDSVHGRLKGRVQVIDGKLYVNGKNIRVTSEKDPSKFQWDVVNTDVVIECTRYFKTMDKAKLHLENGAKKVVIAASSVDAPMFIMGVNHSKITYADTIVSNSSGTANCLAPIAKILHQKFGIIEGAMTAIHASSSSQSAVDVQSTKDFRRGRSALLNIIPATTGAAIAVGEIIPELKGRLSANAMRVPVGNVSVIDLTVKLAQETTYLDIIKALDSASKTTYKGIVGVMKNCLVSQDFLSDPRTSIIDVDAGAQINPTFFKIIAWYDNEYGYSSKLIDLAVHVALITKP